MSSYARFKVGPYTVIAYDWDLGYEYHVRNDYNPGVSVPFPTERAALDWIFWMVMGRERDVIPSISLNECDIYADIGMWLVAKYRAQIKGRRGDALRNMKKQGLPRNIINHIIEGV